MRTPVVRVLRLTGSLAVPLLMGAFVAATIVGPLRPVRLVTSYPLLSPALAVLDVAAGATLIGAGAMAWLFRQRLVGLLAMVAGACWFGPDWAGGLEVDPLLRATSLAASTLVLPLLVGMVLGNQRALRRWPIGALVALLVVITAVLAGAWMRWYAGRLDARCLELCAMDPISADADFRLARSMLIALMALQVVAAFALAAWSVVRLWRASAIGRRIGGPILAPAIVVGLAWAAWAIGSTQPSTVTSPTEQLMIGVFVARAFSLMALAIGLGAAVLRAWRSVQGVRGIAWRISPLPGGGSLRAALASALGDPTLALRFPLPGSGALVDSDGRSAAAVLPGQAVRIEHGAELVALAVTSVPGGEAVAGDLGDAVRLAAANERLLAAVRHDVEELRLSRTRIVRTGDAERHRLERDLHDGAQQRMLAVLSELVQARDAARAAGDAGAAARLDAAVAETDTVIEALRRIARGIHPGLLTEAGLVAALEQLAVDAPLPVELDAPADVACGEAAAAIAWRVVADTIAQAAAAGADEVRLGVAENRGELRITVQVERAATALDLVPLEDRAGAGGGSVTQGAATDATSGLRSFIVTLPCA